MTVDDIRKHFRKARDYEKACRDGKIGAAVEEAVKIYKSHRRLNFDSSSFGWCFGNQWLLIDVLVTKLHSRN